MNPATKQLVKIAYEWIGTPFYPHMGIKGVGADCVHGLLSIFQEAAILPPNIQLPAYSLDGGSHLQRSILIDWLSCSPYFVKEDQRVGSIVAFTMGRVVHHAGVVISKTEFLHTIRQYGTIVSLLSDCTWQRRIHSFWTPKSIL